LRNDETRLMGRAETVRHCQSEICKHFSNVGVQVL
jgi:hypothetical protein